MTKMDMIWVGAASLLHSEVNRFRTVTHGWIFRIA